MRQLENAVRQALLQARSLAITVDQLQSLDQPARSSGAAARQTHAAYIAELLARVQRGEETSAYWKMLADLEGELFAQAIRLAQGNQAKAARWLGVTRLKMREKLTELGLRISDPEP